MSSISDVELPFVTLQRQNLDVESEQAVTMMYGAKQAGYIDDELRCPAAGEA